MKKLWQQQTPRREKKGTEVTRRTAGRIQLCGAYSLTTEHSGVISPVWRVRKRTGCHSKYNFFSVQIGERSEKGNYTVINRALENKAMIKFPNLPCQKKNKNGYFQPMALKGITRRALINCSSYKQTNKQKETRLQVMIQVRLKGQVLCGEWNSTLENI